jgi:amidase
VKLMTKSKLDALVTPDFSISSVLAIGGFPGISVLADHDTIGAPFGICFRGLKGSEPKLIEMAFGLEQASKIKKPHVLQRIISYAPAQDPNFFLFTLVSF